MTSKINSHRKEINLIMKCFPVGTLVIEGAQFDIQYMKDPSIRLESRIHWAYQQGVNYGYENTRKRVLDRDGHICQFCGRKTSKELEVHHIVYRNNGGSNEDSNLITLCHDCHTKLHQGKIDISSRVKAAGKRKGNYFHATQMNSIRMQLLKSYPAAIETFGYVTSANRKNLGYSKSSHWLDAAVIAAQGKPFVLRTDTLFRKRCCSKGDFQQRKGSHSEKAINTGKMHGFRKFDKVRYLGGEYFIKGRMSSGYARLMGIDGKEVHFTQKGAKTPKMQNMHRITARTSWMITSEPLTANII